MQRESSNRDISTPPPTQSNSRPGDHESEPNALQNAATDSKYDAGKTEIVSVSKIEGRATTSLKANPRNARTHSKKQIAKIARSIECFGFVNPILVDRNCMIVAGHGRWQAAKMIGLATVPVIVVDHLSEAEKRALVIADNKIAADAGWDYEMLVAELGELAVLLPEAEIALDIEITGFETPEIDLLLDAQPEAQPDRDDRTDLEPSVNPVSRRGDVWRLGKHRICCGDARIPETVAGPLNGRCAKLVIVDPPYNVSVRGHVGSRGKTKHPNFAFANGELTPDEYRAFLTEALKVLIAASAEGTLIYVFIDWRHVEDLIAVGRALCLELRNLCVWHKTTPRQGSFYRSAHELVPVFLKPGAKPINNVELGRYGRNRTNVWTYAGVNTFKTGKGDDLAIHPTVKPIAMIADAIQDASRRGDIVLDTFLGSGTTLLACERTGRICYGVEYDPGYVDLAIRRWQELTGKDAALLARQGFFDPDPDCSDGSRACEGLTFDELAAETAKRTENAR